MMQAVRKAERADSDGFCNLILDVDGTLWDTTEVVAGAWNAAARADGRTRADIDAKRLKGLFGKPMDEIASLLFGDVDRQAQKDLLHACVRLEHEALQKEERELCYPEVQETFRKLAAAGKKLFIVSNCQCGYIELFLAKSGLGKWVSDTECFGNTGLSKGENISLLMERNGLCAEQTAYVGDTLGDFEAAEAAGISFIFAAYGFGRVEGTKKIRSFSGLLDLKK